MTPAEFYKNYFTPGTITTDSRKTGKGSVFVALKGDTFNGNDFAVHALNSGASLVVVDEKIELSDERVIMVSNTLTFLQELANYHRVQNKFHVIGLTGTNGKTTTKELIHSVLSERYNVKSTRGNLNNHIGVPLTLLSIEPDTDIVVIEMGANHAGEIRALCDIAYPDSGLITNIGVAHLEGFGSFEGVKKAKGELYEYIKTQKGVLYCNGTDQTLREMIGTYDNCKFYNSDDGLCTGRIISTYPFLKAEITSNTQSVLIHTHLFGTYNLLNILASASVAIDHGIDLGAVKRGIEKFKPSNFRSQILQIGSCTVILDCYNANPSSMEQAIRNVVEYEGSRKILILGSMKELGSYSHHEHQKLTEFAESYDFDTIILFGSEFESIRSTKSHHTNSIDEIIHYLDTLDLRDSLILIKGSRANKMERLKEAIENHHSSSIS